MPDAGVSCPRRIRDRRSDLRSRLAVAAAVRRAEVAVLPGRVVEVPGGSRHDRQTAACAASTAGGDEAGDLGSHGPMRRAVAAGLARLPRPLRPHFRRRPVLEAVGGMARPGGPAAAPAGPRDALDRDAHALSLTQARSRARLARRSSSSLLWAAVASSSVSRSCSSRASRARAYSGAVSRLSASSRATDAKGFCAPPGRARPDSPPRPASRRSQPASWPSAFFLGGEGNRTAPGCRAGFSFRGDPCPRPSGLT
jgi:hypothetical protein